ncbi:hypothetical protein CU098_008323 [Rhizopus stolonifer]|uniref:Uncharacterized protein n=1 Tax=Rhizopus stolonifer TaxID=4846 RepID=A0A367KL08_RHIST|nr:hypothetical protein CU098_008323 [Rhizopus stolonifer]
MTSVTPAEGDAKWLKKRSSIFNNTPNTNTNVTDGNVEKKVVDKELARLKNIGAVSSVWTNKFVQDDNPGAKRLSFGGIPTTTPKSPTFSIRARRTLSENNKELANKITSVLQDADTSNTTLEPQEALATGKDNKDQQTLPETASSTVTKEDLKKDEQNLSKNTQIEDKPLEPSLTVSEKQPPSEDATINPEECKQSLSKKATTDVNPEEGEPLPKENPKVDSEEETKEETYNLAYSEEHDDLPKEAMPPKVGLELTPKESEPAPAGNEESKPLPKEEASLVETTPKDVLEESLPKKEVELPLPKEEILSTETTPEEDQLSLVEEVKLTEPTPKTEELKLSSSEEATLLTEARTDLEQKGLVTESVPAPSLSKEEISEESTSKVNVEQTLPKEEISLTESTPEDVKQTLLKEEISLAATESSTPKENLDEAASLWFQYETLKTQHAQMNARLNKTFENIGFYKRQLESFEKNGAEAEDMEDNVVENKRASSGSALSMVLAANANLDEATSLWFQCETLKTQNARINARLNKASEDMEFYKRQLESLDTQPVSKSEEQVTEKEDNVPKATDNIELDEAASLWFQCETLKTQYAQINARFNKANEEISFYKSQLETLDSNTRESLDAAAEERDREVARVRQLAELIVKQNALMNEYEVSLESLNKSANQAHSPDPQIQALQQELADLYKKKDEMEDAILALRAEVEMAHSQMQLMMLVSSEIQNEFESYKQKMNYGIKGMLEDQQQEHESQLEALEQKFTIMAAETRQKEIEEALGSHLQELEDLKQHALDATEAKEREIASVHAAHAQELEALERKLTEAAAQVKETEITLVRNGHLLELQALEKKLTETASEDKEREMTTVRDGHFQELQALETRLMEAASEAKEFEIALVRDSHLQELQALEKELTEAAIEARKVEITAVNEAHSRELEVLTQKLMATAAETKQREVVSDTNVQELESLRKKISELSAIIEEKEQSRSVVVNDNLLQELESLRKKVTELTKEVEVKDNQIKAAVNEREITLKMVLEQVAELKKLKEELCEMERKSSKISAVNQQQDITKIVMEQVNELKKIKQELCERERLSRATLDEREIVSKIVLEQVIELKKLKDELCKQEKAIAASAEHSANTIKSLQDQVVQLNSTLEQKDQSIAGLKKQIETQKINMEAQIMELTQIIMEKDAQLLESKSNVSVKNNMAESELSKADEEGVIVHHDEIQRQIPQNNNYVYTTSSDEEEGEEEDEEEIQPTEQFHNNNKSSTVMYESSDEEEKQATDDQRFSYSSFHSNSSVTPSTPLPPLPMPSGHESELKQKEKSPVPTPPIRRGRSQTMVREEAPSPYTTSIHQINELARIVPLQKENKFENSAPVPPPRKDVKKPVLETSSPALPQTNEQPLNTKWMDDPESEEEEHLAEAQVVQ